MGDAMADDIQQQLELFGVSPGSRVGAQVHCVLEQLLQGPVPPSLSGVYETTARRFGVRTARVERNVRKTVICLWERTDAALLHELMPWHAGEEPPGSREFLCALAARLRIARAERAYHERLLCREKEE